MTCALLTAFAGREVGYGFRYKRMHDKVTLIAGQNKTSVVRGTVSRRREDPEFY
jgi:hypothetical protein